MVMQQQVEDAWCWAAVAVSVDHYFNTASTWTQCKLAKNLVGNGKDCCADPSACNGPAKLQVALETIGRLVGQPILGQLPFEQLQTTIASGFPVCVRIGWAEGGAHFVVIDGCGRSPANEALVHVQDPSYGESTTTFSDFANSYLDHGKWTATFLLKEKEGER
jgi:hypothetical protein